MQFSKEPWDIKFSATPEETVGPLGTTEATAPRDSCTLVAVEHVQNSIPGSRSPDKGHLVSSVSSKMSWKKVYPSMPELLAFQCALVCGMLLQQHPWWNFAQKPPDPDYPSNWLNKVWVKGKRKEAYYGVRVGLRFVRCWGFTGVGGHLGPIALLLL